MDMDARIQAATDYINDICAPEKMSPEEAVAFLEGVAANIDGSLDALKESMTDF